MNLLPHQKNHLKRGKRWNVVVFVVAVPHRDWTRERKWELNTKRFFFAFSNELCHYFHIIWFLFNATFCSVSSSPSSALKGKQNNANRWRKKFFFLFSMKKSFFLFFFPFINLFTRIEIIWCESFSWLAMWRKGYFFTSLLVYVLWTKLNQSKSLYFIRYFFLFYYSVPIPLSTSFYPFFPFAFTPIQSSLMLW